MRIITLLLLSGLVAGCLSIEQQDKTREANWEVISDCEGNTLQLNMRIDRSEDIDAHSVTK